MCGDRHPRPRPASGARREQLLDLDAQSIELPLQVDLPGLQHDHLRRLTTVFLLIAVPGVKWAGIPRRLSRIHTVAWTTAPATRPHPGSVATARSSCRVASGERRRGYSSVSRPDPYGLRDRSRRTRRTRRHGVSRPAYGNLGTDDRAAPRESSMEPMPRSPPSAVQHDRARGRAPGSALRRRQPPPITTDRADASVLRPGRGAVASTMLLFDDERGAR